MVPASQSIAERSIALTVILGDLRPARDSESTDRWVFPACPAGRLTLTMGSLVGRCSRLITDEDDLSSHFSWHQAGHQRAPATPVAERHRSGSVMCTVFGVWFIGC